MNAQEAIEVIDRYKERVNNGTLSISEQITYREALSIVLESAKLFHEHTVPDLKRDNVRFGRSKKYKTVYGVPLEKVGIDLDKEKGADE